MIHVFEESVAARVVLLFLVLVPIGVSVLASRGLVDVIRVLVT